MSKKTNTKYLRSGNTIEVENDFFDQIPGIGNQSQSIEIVNFSEVKIEAGIDYHNDILRSRERAFIRKVREMDNNIHEIMMELRKLIISSKVLQSEFVQVSLDQVPVNIGEYHINFFEWILTVIHTARKKVENSEIWLNTIKSKKSKKTGYWRMFQKHGTTFGLSDERIVATQTG